MIIDDDINLINLLYQYHICIYLKDYKKAVKIIYEIKSIKTDNKKLKNDIKTILYVISNNYSY